MNAAEREKHWQSVYTTKRETEVSWFEENPAPSLDLIALVGAGRPSAVIDIGGGASRLVDRLILQGYEDLTVLDISAADGHAIIGAFALDGPEMCSGLPVARYDGESLGKALGPAFLLVDTRRHDHLTPRGVTQHLQFSVFRFGADAA
jgi:hypothetical protein